MKTKFDDFDNYICREMKPEKFEEIKQKSQAGNPRLFINNLILNNFKELIEMQMESYNYKKGEPKMKAISTVMVSISKKNIARFETKGIKGKKKVIHAVSKHLLSLLFPSFGGSPDANLVPEESNKIETVAKNRKTKQRLQILEMERHSIKLNFKQLFLISKVQKHKI